MTFAEWIFYANGYDKDSKVTRLAQWNQVKKSSGVTPEGLARKPHLSPELIPLWSLYVDIKNGADVITYSELISYQAITGVELSPWEASLMIDIEKVRIKYAY